MAERETAHDRIECDGRRALVVGGYHRKLGIARIAKDRVAIGVLDEAVRGSGVSVEWIERFVERDSYLAGDIGRSAGIDRGGGRGQYAGRRGIQARPLELKGPDVHIADRSSGKLH